MPFWPLSCTRQGYDTAIRWDFRDVAGAPMNDKGAE